MRDGFTTGGRKRRNCACDTARRLVAQFLNYRKFSSANAVFNFNTAIRLSVGLAFDRSLSDSISLADNYSRQQHQVEITRLETIEIPGLLH